MNFYLREVKSTIASARGLPILDSYARRMEEGVERLEQVTSRLVQVAQKGDMEVFLADATLYLDFFGIVTAAWQWLLQGLCIERALGKGPSDREMRFYKGKLYALRYFFHYELPKTEGLAKRLMEADGLTSEMSPSLFED